MNWKDIAEPKKQIKGHAKALCNVFRMGENWGESGEQRTRNVANEDITVIPKTRMAPKDHKPVGPDGVPQVKASL